MSDTEEFDAEHEFCFALRTGKKEEAFAVLLDNKDLLQNRRCFATAVKLSDVDLLQQMVDLGAAYDALDRYGCTHIYYGVFYNRYENVKFLLELGVNADQGVPIMNIVEIKKTSDRIKMCELLLEHGANINQDLEKIPGYNVLLKAMDDEDHELVEFLKSRGAVADVASPDEVVETIELDLATLPQRLEASIKNCWQDVTKKHPKEQICLFGLETDSDFVLVNPLFDSHDAIDKDKKNRHPVDSYIGRVSLDSDSSWYGQGKEHLNEISLELNSVYFKEETDKEFYKRKEKLLSIFMEVMSKLDKEGLFGRAEERGQILLMVSIIDADDTEWALMLDIIKKLNPEAVAQQFIDSCK